MNNIKTVDFLLDIASEKNGYKIAEPWRFHEFSLTAVIPLVRENPLARTYRLLSENISGVKIKDTGNISEMEITNNTEFPVLAKQGEVVVGGTQSRILTISQVIMAGEKVRVPCCCVYSSKGIVQGQSVSVGSYAPTEVRSSVYKGYKGSRYNYDYGLQQNIWRSVAKYSSVEQNRFQARASYAKKMASSPSNRREEPRVGYASTDNLTDILASLANTNSTYHTPQEDLAGRVAENEDKLKEVIKKVPKLDNQIGLALVTMNGIETLESFDHTDSWDALRKNVLKAEAGKIADLSDQDSMFEFKKEKAKELVKLLLTSKYTEETVVEKPNTATITLLGDKFNGEVVILNNIPIHCSFVKKAV